VLGVTQCPTFSDGMVPCEYINNYGFPSTVGQTNVTAACSHHGCTNYTNTSKILQLASQASNTAISVYSKFATLPTSVLFWPVKSGKGGRLTASASLTYTSTNLRATRTPRYCSQSLMNCITAFKNWQLPFPLGDTLDLGGLKVQLNMYASFFRYLLLHAHIF
jgi:hypothetical protein